MVWNMNRGYETKVITLPPKISTITSNEEKEMIMSKETCYSIKTCSSSLNFFVKINVLGKKCPFSQNLKIYFRKKFKLLPKGCCMAKRVASKSSEQYIHK